MKARKKKLNIEEVSDLDLIKTFQKGCSFSFETLVSRYETKVHSLAMRLTRNAEGAEEVLQDVFITVYRKAKSFEGKAKFSSWLYRITCNAAFMKLRKRKQEQAFPMEDMMPHLQERAMNEEVQFNYRCDNVTLNNEIRQTLETAIGKLPEEYRAVFILRDVDGLSNKEVGDILDLSIPAVKSRLHRSRLMLRKKLKRFYEDYTHGERVVSVGPQMIQKAA